MKNIVFCVDNDSTLMEQEIIDEVARFVGKSAVEKIEKITDIQMNGDLEISFQESLDRRVNTLIDEAKKMGKKISSTDLQNISSRQMSFSPGVCELLQKIITRKGTLQGNFFILSGGFVEIIHEKISELPISDTEKKILMSQTRGNYFLYDSQQNIIGMDWEKSEMFEENAKGAMISLLQKNGEISEKNYIVALGDGSNDIDMVRGKNGEFFAYTGVIARKNTLEQSKGKEFKNFFEVGSFYEIYTSQANR